MTEVKRSTPLGSQSTLANDETEIDDPEKKAELEKAAVNDHSAGGSAASPEAPGPNGQNILTGIRLVTAMFSLLLTILCVALDNTSTSL